MKEAKKYSSKKSFYKSSSGAYAASLKLGIHDAATQHMSSITRTKWTRDKVFEIVRECFMLKDFRDNYPAAYTAAYRYGWMDEVKSFFDQRLAIN